MKSDVALLSDIPKNLSELKSEFQRFLNSSNLHIADSEFLTTEAALFLKKTATPAKEALTQLILQHFIRAENQCPGAGLKLLQSWVSNASLPNLEIQRRRATLTDVRNLLDSLVKNQSLRETLWDALDLTGFNGKILVETTNYDKPVLEVTSGHVFLCQTLIQAVGHLHQPRVIVIDGFIESVSEINVLLEQAAETLDHVLIFARGFSADVLNTLGVNLRRGSLSVHAFVVPYDLNSVNVLKDIAVVTDSDLISSFKGDLISSITLSDCKRITFASVWSDRVILSANPTSTSSINVLLQELKQKRAEQTDETVIEILSKRISSLATGQIAIKIPKHTSVSDKQTIDRVLRSVRSLVDLGVTDDGELVMRRLVVSQCLQNLNSQLGDLGAIISV